MHPIRKLKFSRTEEIEIELPIAGPFHRSDAKAFANAPCADTTILEAHAIAQLKTGKAKITASEWDLAEDDSETQIGNPFATLPAPPRPRGRRPGSLAGHAAGGDPPGGEPTDPPGTEG